MELDSWWWVKDRGVLRCAQNDSSECEQGIGNREQIPGVREGTGVSETNERSTSGAKARLSRGAVWHG
jgi:hypothetical protein